MPEYRVTLADGSGFTVEAGEAVLDAALRQGVSLPYGCRNGVCGSCRLKLAAGQVEYPYGKPQALSEADDKSGYALMCQARAASDLTLDWAPAEVDAPPEPRIMPARVAAIDILSKDVCRVLLDLPPGKRLPFMAGQYIDILLADGARRSFSLANPPHDDERLELHIRHVAGGRFTEYVFGQLQPGTWLRFEGPLGQFYLREDSSRPVILVAGGTGFAPLKSILERVISASIERSFTLYRGVNSVAGLYMDELARGWGQMSNQRAGPQIGYVPVVASPQPHEKWQGRQGFVHEAVIADHDDLAGYDIYMAGPPPMIEAARVAFVSRGVDPQRLFFDSFVVAGEQKS